MADTPYSLFWRLEALRQAGVYGVYRNPRLFLVIPNWKMFREVYALREVLYKYNMVHAVFSTPASPIKPAPEAAKCSYCKHVYFKCPFGEMWKIPAATYEVGCELFVENKSVYF